MTDRGTLIIARSLVDHPALATEPFDRRSAWLWLLTEAAWATREIVVDRRRVALCVGELVGSSRYLATKWQWTEPKVRRFLSHLKREGMIDLRVVKAASQDPGITVIQVANFEAWQTVATRRTSDAPPDALSDAPTDAPPRTVSDSETEGLFVAARAPDACSDAPVDAGGVFKPTQDTINNKKESKILRFQSRAKGQSAPSSEDPLDWPADAFDQWYRAYPRKKAPKDARRAFEKLRAAHEITFADLIAATERYASEVNAWPRDRRQYIPYPSTWLNDGCYAEEPDIERTGSRNGAPAPRNPSTFTDADWSERVRGFRGTGEWSGLWGPEPGAEGCRVPIYILDPPASHAGGSR